MENKKNLEEMADEALEAVSGGAGKLEKGWICANCHKEVKVARGKNDQAYCIPCYTKLFGDPNA